MKYIKKVDINRQRHTAKLMVKVATKVGGTTNYKMKEEFVALMYLMSVMRKRDMDVQIVDELLQDFLSRWEGEGK